MSRKRYAIRRGGGSRWWCLGVGVLAFMFSSPVYAQHWSLHGAGAVTNAFSDNANNGDGTADNPETASFFYQVSPSLLFTFQTPRTTHVLTAGVDFIDYLPVVDVDPNVNLQSNFNGALTHNSLFVTSRTTELQAGASMAFGETNSITGGTDAATTDTQATSSTFRRGALTQTFRWQFAKNWRLSETLNGEVGATEPSTGGVVGSPVDTRTLGLAFTLDRAWTRTSAGLSGSVAGVNSVVTMDGADDQTTNQLTTNLALTAMRDISARWAANGSVGIATLTTFAGAPTADETQTTQIPSFSAGVNYFRPLGTVTLNLGLSANQNFTTNVLTGNTTQTTGATFTGAIPLPWFRRGRNPTVRVSSTIGGAYSTVAGEADPPKWTVITGDLSAAWSIREAWDLSLRYQYANQNLVAMGDTTLLAGAIPTEFARNTVMVQLSGRWPTRQATTMPDRRVLRVDRANQRPVGDEGQSAGGGNAGGGNAGGGSE